MASSSLRFLDHTQRRTTVSRTPLHEWSARQIDFYLTTQSTHKRQTSIPPEGFEPIISASERPHTARALGQEHVRFGLINRRERNYLRSNATYTQTLQSTNVICSGANERPSCSDTGCVHTAVTNLCSDSGCVHKSVTILCSFPKPSGKFGVSLLWPVWGQAWIITGQEMGGSVSNQRLRG